jgi:glycolate oxidase FAD binding subunit
MGCCGAPWCQALTEFPAWKRGEDVVTFKVNVLPSGIASFCRQADTLRERPLLQAHAGNGIVIGHLGPGTTAASAANALQALRHHAKPLGGHVNVLSCPPAWKRSIDVWGPAPADTALMRAVKNQLDPRGIFNPGRFVDGI